MQLTNKEILEKAIQKAIDGGWKPFADLVFDAVSKDGSGYAWCGHWERYVQMELNGNLPPDYRPVARTHDLATERLIFNHDFAKALWGEEKYMAYFAGYNEWSDATDIEYVEDQDYDEEPHEKKPIWQYHLQQMVISENPIQYLGEHLDG